MTQGTPGLASASDTLAGVTNETVGQEIARRRAALNMSVRQLHEASGVHRNTLGKIERDDPTVEPFTVERVRQALERLEHRYGVDAPDSVIQVLEIELPDGTKAKVTYTGTPENVAEAAARFLAKRRA